jgi:hypothetical protein
MPFFLLALFVAGKQRGWWRYGFVLGRWDISTLSHAGLLGWYTGKRDSVEGCGLWFAVAGGPYASSLLTVSAVGVVILGTDLVFRVLAEG